MLTLANSDPETQHYCEFLGNESSNALLVLWAVMQPSWQTLPARGCSATINEMWSSHPSWSESACEAHCFPAECQKWVCKKRHWTEPMRWKWVKWMCHDNKSIPNLHSLHIRHASGANNSPARRLMETSSPEVKGKVSAAPNTCRSSVPQLKYTLTLWHERYKNAIWGEAKPIMWCVIGRRDRNTTSCHTFQPWPL